MFESDKEGQYSGANNAHYRDAPEWKIIEKVATASLDEQKKSRPDSIQVAIGGDA